MEKPIEQTETPRDIVGKGLEEARELIFFNKIGTANSQKKILRAIEYLNKDEWHHGSHKNLCKIKLVHGLNILKQQANTKPEIEPKVTHVKKKRKKVEQTKLIED